MADNTTQPYIPTHILTSILIHLPSKTLLKLLTISKTWYSLITSPTFILSHYNHHKHLSNHHLFLHEPHSHFSLFHYGHPFNHRTLLPSPPSHFTSVSSSINGLILLFNSKLRNLLLWNPSINKSLHVPRLPLFCFGGGFESFTVVGLGFDCLNNDYKVVCFDYFRGVVENVENCPCVQVYSVNGGVRLGWRRVLLPFCFLGFDFSHISESCFASNFIHWIIFQRDVRNYIENGVIEFGGAWVLTFDPRNDSFGRLELPKVLNEAVDPDLCLAVIDDSIAVIHISGDDDVYSKYCAVVWKLEGGGCGGEVEEQWKVLYRISLPYLYGTNPNLWDEEDGKVFITTSLGTLIVFNIKNGRSGSSCKFDGEVALIVGQAYSYTESLVLLDRFSGASWLRKGQLQG